MSKELAIVDLIDKVGGRYSLSVLIQKRYRDILNGAPILVDQEEGETVYQSILKEIDQGRINLETSKEEKELIKNTKSKSKKKSKKKRRKIAAS